jgi:pimeloyl-ACP methyl ester carboxylesterase
VDGAFWGWNRAWLDPEFRKWNIESFLPRVRVPLLVIQGEDDEYGTVAQLAAISRQVGGGSKVVLLPDCGHAPHRDQRERALRDMTDFIQRTLGRRTER